nr:immunoglobulin heavy chain junction region [Mus musculus]MBK4186007.1 immunoglobulin heavy chain junction region [Mus musculus]
YCARSNWDNWYFDV